MARPAQVMCTPSAALASHPPAARRSARALPPAPPNWRRGPGVVQTYYRSRSPNRSDSRVVLHGGVCPCCARRFKAAAPAGLEPGSPFGPNLRAFVLYLRFGQAIPFERLARLMRDLFGLEISEGALANLLQHSAQAFAAQASLIKRACCPARCWPPTRPACALARRPSGLGVHHADSAAS